MKNKSSGGVKAGSAELSSAAEVTAPRQQRPTDNGELRRVALDKIVPSPFQNRKTFKTADWPGFVESVRISGVIQPGVGREVNGHVELVCGERRFRASQELKLAEMPLIIRTLSDEQVQEMLAVENLQREGLNPLEEAQGFADWIARLLKGSVEQSSTAENGASRQQRPTVKTMKEAVAYISERVGKGRTIIYESLKLVKLGGAAKTAMEKGELDPTKAALIAGVAAAVQPQLLKEALNGRYGRGEPMSAKELKQWINEKYQRQLNQAPFKQDAMLTSPKAGDKMGTKINHPICTPCLYRSGNIEGYEGNPNVCTNVECYQKKVEAYADAKLEEAKAAGARTMSADQYERQHYNLQETKDTCYADSKGRSYGTLAKLAAVNPIVAVDKEGELHEVFTSEDVSKIKSANKLKDYSGGGNGSDRKAAADYAKKKKEFMEAAHNATWKVLEALVPAKGIDSRLWLMLSDAVAGEAGIERTTFVAKRLGIAKTQTEAHKALEAWLTSKERTDLDRMRFVVEVLLCAHWLGGGWQKVEWNADFVDLCKLAGGTPEDLSKKRFMEKMDKACETANQIATSFRKSSERSSKKNAVKQKPAKKTKGKK